MGGVELVGGKETAYKLQLDVMVVCQQMFLALKMDEEDIYILAGSKLERALK